ncbi:MAG: flagellar hook-length control protein FliK [Halopseudomonas sp.]|uniref:flagellar hook-length control protein FliK n=1 Tax=Halopseudomonas sp. TaxID=2901191 RepID=UPI0030029973
MSTDFRLPPIAATPPSAPTTPAAAPTVRPGDAITLALQLLRPIDALQLGVGDKISAEVVQSSPRPNANGQFDVLLRLAQGATGTAATTLPATSPQPVSTGTQMLVQALSQTQLMAVLQPATGTPAAPPLTRLDPAQFPPGSTLQAQVLSQQPVSEGAGKQLAYALLAKVVQGAGNGSVLQLTSSQPVEPGTKLNASVGAQGELRVLASSAQQRQLDLLQGLRSTLQSQASSEPLLSRLDQLQAAPRSLPAVPALQQAITQVLQQIATPQQLTTASGVATAIKQSGLFLEPNLARLAESLIAQTATKQTASPTPAGTEAGGVNPASAARALPALEKLLPLLASLSKPGAAEPLVGVDLKGTLVNLLINLQQQLPPGSLGALALPPGPWQQASQAAAQQQLKAGMFPLPTRALQALGETNDLGSLLRLTAALLSRIQHHQFQSLGQTQSFADGSTQTTWQLEIPLRDGQQFNHVQMRIQQDNPPPNAKQAEPVPQWEVRLAFNLDELGSLQAIARLRKDKVSSEFWAERANTLSLVSNELTELRDRLLAKGLEVGELSCHRGTPPPPRQAVQQSWIDEVT